MRWPAPRALRERAFLVETLFLLDLDLGHVRERLRALAASGLDWERVLDVATWNLVAPAVCHALARDAGDGRGALAELLPPASRARALDLHESYAAANAMILHEAVGVQRALAARGLESLLLKGAALLAAHYPAVGARHLDDVDILVRPGQDAEAARALLALGYRHLDAPLDHRGRPVVGHEHLPPLVGPLGVNVELHRELPGIGERFDADGVWSRARTVPCAGATARIPSAEDLLAIACAHVFAHHRGDWRYLARHVCDVHVLARTGASAAGAAGAAGAGSATGAGEAAVPGVAESRALLVALGRASGAGAPAGRVAAADRLRAATLFTPAAPILAHLGDVVAIGLDSPSRLPRRLFPSRQHMAWRYGVSPSSPRLPLLYARRLLDRLRGPLHPFVDPRRPGP